MSSSKKQTQSTLDGNPTTRATSGKADVVLTGIKPSGVPHIGNYFGSMKPSIEAANASTHPSFLFLADYHALTTVKSAAELQQYVKDVSCAWLACGLDTTTTVFYRQSDVPQTFELATILSNVTPKGLMNRAHAYKAVTAAAEAAGRELDGEVSMGLFNYPVLMSADILLFDTNWVPVGSDQKQHIEIAADIAKAFNAVYGDVLVVPQPKIEKEQATIPGLDSRKMSKSYGNQIPLFAPEAELKNYIKKIVTDSSAPTEPKSTDSLVFILYQLFATPEEVREMEKRFKRGIGWGEAKDELFRVVNRKLAPMRERYEHYVNNYHEVEEILDKGAAIARGVAEQTLKRVRSVIGART